MIWVACLCAHEAGHALAAVLFGGTVTGFVLLSDTPHVDVSGRFTPAQDAVTSAAGSGLILLLWTAGALVAPHSWELLVRVSGMFGAIELLAWTIGAGVYPHSGGEDDVSRFLLRSGTPRVEVLAACVALAFGGVMILRLRSRKRRLSGKSFSLAAASGR